MTQPFGKLEKFLELGRTRGTAEWREIWSQFGAKDRAVYFSEVTRRREALGLPKIDDGIGRTFFTDLTIGVRSGALREADKLPNRVSLPVRLAWMQEKLRDEGFLDRMRSNPIFDECVDRLIGLNERKLKRRWTGDEESLPKDYLREDTYLDSPPEDLFTPYRVLKEVFVQISPKKGETVVDLGSGLGRVGAYVGLFHPGVSFKGYEIVAERHHQASVMAKQLKLSKDIQFYCEDIGRKNWKLPTANYFFLFNPFSLKTLLKTMDQMLRLSMTRDIRVVTVQIGRPPRQIKKLSWLKEEWTSPPDDIWPGKGVSIYKSTRKQRLTDAVLDNDL